jgi:predicted kinase
MPAILVLTGASGAGKTTLLRALEVIEIPGVACFPCDSVYRELLADVRADGEAVQDAILEHWVRQALAQSGLKVAVLDTQIRPQKALALLRRLGIAVHRIVLVECEQAEREARLRGPRAQPELVDPQMEHWAAYLRGQADALGLDRIDTTHESIVASSARLRALVESLSEQGNQANNGRLVIVCGLPGSGKTTHAKVLAAKIPGAVRFCPDEWMGAAGINLWDQGARAQIEACQWQLAPSLLSHGSTVIIEWGTWGRSERDTLRLGARALDASVELHYLNVPVEVLFERIRVRKLESPAISLADLHKWSEAFERPDSEEMALFDVSVTVTE